MLSRSIFVAGGTGYLGGALLPQLIARGHHVNALVRAGAGSRLPGDVQAVFGNALDGASYAATVRGCDTFIHLVGVRHPGPTKEKQFRSIDLVSLHVAVAAARAAGVGHFIYLSVAQPAPVMRAYQAVRAEGEAAIRAAGLTATFVRPWYVLGPGHRWPYLILPLTSLLERLPSTRETARRLGFVTLAQMTAALLHAAENPPVPGSTRIIGVPELRAATD